MAGMYSGKCRARGDWRASCILFAAVLAGVSLPCFAARQWDSGAAETALTQARALRKQLTADQAADAKGFLSCIRLYQRVYASDPHYTGSDDAIYEAATLYQEMAVRFSLPEYDREAAQLLKFLIKDYPSSEFRPYAILRLAAMETARAGPPKGIPGVPARSHAVGQDVPPATQAAPAIEQSPAFQKAAHAAAVRRVYCRSAPASTQVTIELDERPGYQVQRISSPERFFVDFSNTWLVLDSSDTVIAVNDRLLRRVRAAQNQPGLVRVVLDLKTGAECTVSEMSGPFRIVIDIRGGQSPVSPRN